MEIKDLTREQLESLLEETKESNFRLTNIILENTKTIEFLQEYQQEAKALRSVVYCLEKRIEGYFKYLKTFMDTVDFSIREEKPAETIFNHSEFLTFANSEAKLGKNLVLETNKEISSDSDLEDIIESPTSLETRTFLLIEAVKEFVDRVEKGEVRSKYTYSKFKEILKRF